MFRLCVKSFDNQDELIKEGTLNNIAERLDFDCDIKTKYRFLHELVLKGVLIPKENISWGGQDRIIYQIDKDALFELFKSTSMGDEAYRAIRSFALILEQPF
jgi:hypothetical protein